MGRCTFGSPALAGILHFLPMVSQSSAGAGLAPLAVLLYPPVVVVGVVEPLGYNLSDFVAHQVVGNCLGFGIPLFCNLSDILVGWYDNAS